MSDVKLWRYSIPSINGEGWAVFVLGSDGYFSAVSDWGNYAYIWRDTGCKDFREFLLGAERSWDYFAKKLYPELVYDGERTEKQIREHILRSRRDRDISQDEAAKEWLLVELSDLDQEGGFSEWLSNTELDEACRFGIYDLDNQVVQFVRKAMVRLIPLLKADLEAGR